MNAEEAKNNTRAYIMRQPDYQAILGMIDHNSRKGYGALYIENKDYKDFNGVWAECLRFQGYTLKWGSDGWTISWI